MDAIDLQRRVILIPKARAGALEQPVNGHLCEFLARYQSTIIGQAQPMVVPVTRREGRGERGRAQAFSPRCHCRRRTLSPGQILRQTLRHTAITHLVQAGIDLPTVKRIDGHKTMVTVERCSHQNDTRI
jgi:site-specific recombinase XerD